MSSVEKRVIRIVAEQLGVDEAQVSNEVSLMEGLGADSLDTVELVLALEDEFKIEILDESARNIQSVQDAIDFITEHPQIDLPAG